MLALTGALLIGLSLGLLGSGGSILTVPVLVFVAHHPDKLAIAESLGIVCAIASTGTVLHARQQHVDWRTLMLVAPAAMLGSYCGAWLSQFISGQTQLALFAAIMLVAAIRMLITADRDDPQPNQCRPRCLLLLGLGVGMISGIVGVGGGFLVVPALVLLAGLTMTMAVGTSLAIIALSSLVGFLKHLHLLHTQQHDVHWASLLLFVVLGMVGMGLGQPIGKHLPQRQLQQIYGIAVLIMASVMLLHSVLRHFAS